MGLFRCDCGVEKHIAYGNVEPGNTVSCGCLKREQTGEIRVTHRQSGTPLYQCWKDMRNRSTPGTYAQRVKPSYVGVGRDPRWDSFEEFAADMGSTYFLGAVLGRYEDKGDYTPTNCRWITKSESSLEMWEVRRART